MYLVKLDENQYLGSDGKRRIIVSTIAEALGSKARASAKRRLYDYRLETGQKFKNGRVIFSDECVIDSESLKVESTAWRIPGLGVQTNPSLNKRINDGIATLKEEREHRWQLKRVRFALKAANLKAYRNVNPREGFPESKRDTQPKSISRGNKKAIYDV